MIMGKAKSKVCKRSCRERWSSTLPGSGHGCWPGYKPQTTVPQLQLMAHVSKWMEREGLTAAGLTAQQAGRFLAARHAAGSGPRQPAGLRPLLDYLGGLGVLPAEPPEPPQERRAR